MTISRILRHLLVPAWRTRQAFPSRTLDAIEVAVKEAEQHHRGEIRFAVEGALHGHALWRGQSPRDRALDVFSLLRVWDTAENTGVLVYVLLADRAVEIVADRGIAGQVQPDEWSAICRDMQTAFGQRQFESGAVQGLKAIAALLTRHFAADAASASKKTNELPDRPVVL